MLKYLIVGSGLFGAVFAHEVAKAVVDVAESNVTGKAVKVY